MRELQKTVDITHQRVKLASCIYPLIYSANQVTDDAGVQVPLASVSCQKHLHSFLMNATNGRCYKQKANFYDDKGWIVGNNVYKGWSTTNEILTSKQLPN